MTALEPRLDEIQARVDGYSPCRRNDDCGSTECQAERDAKHLLAELRKAHEALAAVSAIEEVLDGWDALIPFHDAEESQRWYSLGKRHAAERIRTEIAEARAAVAAAKGDERG